jgi:hypothetical protein
MKIVCDCGNEQEFKEYDENGVKNSYTEDEGLYVTINKFTFWQTHDVVGIVCDNCRKDIWLFT